MANLVGELKVEVGLLKGRGLKSPAQLELRNNQREIGLTTW